MKKHPIALRVKTLRESYSWSQVELAKKMGVSNVSISKIEQGYRLPSLPMIQKLASVFKCSIESLVTGQPEKGNSYILEVVTFYRKFQSLQLLNESEKQMILKLIKMWLTRRKPL